MVKWRTHDLKAWGLSLNGPTRLLLGMSLHKRPQSRSLELVTQRKHMNVWAVNMLQLKYFLKIRSLKNWFIFKYAFYFIKNFLTVIISYYKFFHLLRELQWVSAILFKVPIHIALNHWLVNGLAMTELQQNFFQYMAIERNLFSCLFACRYILFDWLCHSV